MAKRTLAVFALALASLTGCAYSSEQTCLDSGVAVCHVGALDGKWHPGGGIPVDSMAGAMLIGGYMRSLQPAPSYNVYLRPW